ncbi:MAG: hypothetical protein U9R75_07430, partial [Candidatus Thermoplasmatota archaeon]|nr:hypothetical protein [Candidatus Thermoplasmatota archaeon]
MRAHPLLMNIRSLSILIVVIFLLTTLSRGFSNDNSADLVVKELYITATQDGFLVHIEVKNAGGSMSKTTNALLMDKVSGPDGRPMVISEMRIGNLPSGELFKKDVNWIPEDSGRHLVYLALDVERAQTEVSEKNNIMMVEFSLPLLESVNTPFDGIQDQDVIGTFISGISKEMHVELEFKDISDPSLLRSCLQIDNGSKVYASDQNNGLLIATMNVKDLGPGEHELKINTTYCGVELPGKNLLLEVSPQPNWSRNLTAKEAFFDSEQNCYIISGRSDIPELGYIPDLGVNSTDRELTFCGAAGEILVRSLILADGTTTFISTVDLRVDAVGQRYTMSGSDRIFAGSPDGPVKMHMSSSVEIEIDLDPFLAGRMIEVDGPYGDPVELPFFPEVEGAMAMEMELDLLPSGSEPVSDLSIDLDISGLTRDLLSFDLPGSDRPLISTTSDISWHTVHSCDRGSWTSSGEIEKNYNATFVDLGLSIGVDPDHVDLPLQGTGSDLEMDHLGELGTVSIPPRDGSVTKMIFTHEDKEIEVYGNNTYISGPELSFHMDDSAIVVWSEASYDEDPLSRASSLRLRFGKLQGPENKSFEISSPFNSGYLDHHPDISSFCEKNQTALVWVRDMDSDPRTHEDTEIMTSIYRMGVWSEPMALTDDEQMDSDPAPWFSPEGELWVVWRTGDSMLRYSTRSIDGIWSGPATISQPLGSRVLDMSIGSGDTKVPYLFYSLMDDAGITSLISRTGNPSRDTGWDENTTLFMTGNWIEEPNAFISDEGLVTLVWREQEDGKSNLHAMAADPLVSGGSYSRPIPLTDDEYLQLGTKHIPVGNGDQLLAYTIMNDHGSGNGSVRGGQFHVTNTSWGAGIERLSIDPEYGHSPGSMLKLTVSLEYMGLSPVGSSRVDVYRRYLDRSSGYIQEEFWASTVVDFHYISQRAQVDFTVTVKEYQLGLSVYSVVPVGIGPEFICQKFISLPSIPDPEISSMNMVRADDEQGTAQVVVEVHNWGNVPVGNWELRVLGCGDDAPFILPNRTFEPLLYRGRENGHILNTTRIYIDPGGSATFNLNVTIGSVVFHLWAEIISDGWQPNVKSIDELILIGSPEVELMPSISCESF